MAELARWSLNVSRETDADLRALLAERGRRRGDLSRFVEQAVVREMMLEVSRETHKRNAGVEPAELMELIASELAEVRRFRPARLDPALTASMD